MVTFDQTLGVAVKKGNLSPTESALVREHINEIQSIRGIAESSKISRTKDLIGAAGFVHQAGATLDTITTAQALAATSLIRASPLTKNTARMRIAGLKRFLIWMVECGYSPQIDEKKVRKIRVPDMDFHAKKREDLFTPDEMESIIAACRNSRDRAIVTMSYDGSHRPKEIYTLKWRDLEFDEWGVMVTTSVKTNIERSIRLTYSVPYLRAWRPDYISMRGEIRPDDTVFCSLHHPHNDINYSTLYNLSLELRKRTGNEKVTPGLYRPTKITDDAEANLPLQYLMQKNWGNLGTRMIRCYVKPNKKYIDKIALEHAGIEVPVQPVKKINRSLQPVICPDCKTTNRPGAEFCDVCGYNFSEAAGGYIRRLEKAMQDPQKLREFADWLEHQNQEDT